MATVIGQGKNPAYRAASRRGTFSDWNPTGLGPAAVLEQDRDLIANRARDAYRNNGFVKKAIHTLATSEVGDGIHSHSIAKNKRYRRQIQQLWNQWVFECDAHGSLTFDGIVNQAVINRYLVGGTFIRMIPVSDNRLASVPLILQQIEVDQVPIDKTEDISRGRIKQGIEFNRSGRKVAVHPYKDHPNDTIGGGNELDQGVTVRVPMEDIIHHYEPVRPGQIREIPWVVEGLEVAKRMDDYTHSELTRKHIKSMITGFITREQFTEEDMLFDPWTGEELQPGFTPGNIKLNPGMLGTLNPGEDIKLTDPDNQADGYDQYMRYNLQLMSAALYVPYELVSMDFSQINDRLVRSILDDYRRFINSRQKLVTVPQIIKRVWEKFNDVAVLSGRIDAPDYFNNRSDFVRAEFVPETTPYHHPVQDRTGIKLDMEMGLTTQEEELKKLRKNPQEIIDQLESERERNGDVMAETGVTQ